MIQFGRSGLPTYGVLVAVGLVMGLIVNVNLAIREGLEEDFAWNLGIISIFAGMLGSKLLLAIMERARYAAHPRELLNADFLQSAGVWYGGLFGAVAGGLMYVAYKKQPLLTTLDAFVPGIALGHGIGRLGCFAAGCCYGRPTDEPWGVVFTNPIANAFVGTPLNVRIHPTQLYEFLAEMLIFVVLMWLWKHKQFPGQVFGAYAFLYGIARFISEFYRADPDRGSVFGGAISATQLLSIVMVVVGGLMWIKWQPMKDAVARA